MNHSEITSFIWGVADLIRDTFKRGKYQDVILPLTVLRRLDCVLTPTKSKVLKIQARYAGKIENPDRLLQGGSRVAIIMNGSPLFTGDAGSGEREVKLHVPDAWIDRKRRDPQDGKVGLVGYEINFNRYFYEYRPPRPLEEIEADIQQVEKEIVAMLEEMRV